VSPASGPTAEHFVVKILITSYQKLNNQSERMQAKPRYVRSTCIYMHHVKPCKKIRKTYDLQDKQADKHAICMSMLIRIIILQFAWTHAHEHIQI
jgi:hypothetical protein